MVKSKQTNFVAANTNRKKSFGGDDDWVIVKKQKVNIIIPPSPQQLTLPDPLDHDPHIEVDPRVHSPSEKERSDSSIPKTIRVDDDSRMCPQPIPASLNKSVPEVDLGVSNSSRKIRRLAVSANRNAILHRRIRTLLIEKKLNQLGGLSKWLVSLGLDRFMKIFECNGVDKYQLACLTMGELKDMGAYAVGPRRKLLHAIDCLCKPYCDR